jgi:hypothetical protein
MHKLFEICSITLFLCAFLWLKNLFNQCNLCHRYLCPRYLRLINDLRACKPLYISREIFTDVMSALQIKLFMQNEPKFRKVKFNVNKVLTRNYVQMDTWSIRKNEPKTNPKQTQIKKGQNESKYFYNNQLRTKNDELRTNKNKPNFTLVPGQDAVKIRKTC